METDPEELRKHNIEAMKELNEELAAGGTETGYPSVSFDTLIETCLEEIEAIEYRLGAIWMANDILRERGSSYLESLIARVDRKLNTTHRDLRQILAEWEALDKTLELSREEQDKKKDEYGRFSQPVPKRKKR